MIKRETKSLYSFEKCAINATGSISSKILTADRHRSYSKVSCTTDQCIIIIEQQNKIRRYYKHVDHNHNGLLALKSEDHNNFA